MVYFEHETKKPEIFIERKIESQLLAWKANPNRLPLIVKGARQVGKTESGALSAYLTAFPRNLPRRTRSFSCRTLRKGHGTKIIGGAWNGWRTQESSMSAR